MEMYKERYKDTEKSRYCPRFYRTCAKPAALNPISLAVAWVEASGITAPIFSGRSVKQFRPSLDAVDIVITDEIREASKLGIE